MAVHFLLGLRDILVLVYSTAMLNSSWHIEQLEDAQRASRPTGTLSIQKTTGVTRVRVILGCRRPAASTVLDQTANYTTIDL